MARNTRLSIDGEGYFIAEGTADNKVVITGANQVPGYWRGLIVYSTSAMNSMSYAEVSYSGSNALVSGIKTNVAVYGNHAYLSLRNCQIKGSAGYGIYLYYTSKINEDAESVNTFSDNTEGNIFKN